MANPNSEIYGTPETWQYSFINGGLETDAAKALKIQKAKVPVWNWDDNPGFWKSQLKEAIAAGKATKNVPIDKTVCAVGMGRDCPFAEMGYFRRVIREGSVGDVGLDTIVRVGDGVVNGFLWEMKDTSSHGIYNLAAAGGGQINEKNMTYLTWAPSSDNEMLSNHQNGNYFIAPYTYYQLKTFIMSVRVYVCNSADIPENPEDITQVPAATWRSLDDWKNNYSTHKIIGLDVQFARANQILDSGGRIRYTSPSNPSAYTYSVPCGFGILDELSFDQELQYKIYDYALFNNSTSAGSWITTIFRPFTDTVWNNSVHRIAFFGMFNVFSTYLKYLPGAVWYQIPYSDEIYDNICRAVATFGFIFVTDGNLTVPSTMNTDNICFPVITDDGIAHGDYTRGADNLTNDIYNADSTRDKDYNPINPPHNQYYDHTDLPSTGGTALNWYSDRSSTGGTIHMILGNLFQAIADVADNPNNQQFLFQEPLKNILDYRRILLTQPWGDRPGTNEVIPLGAFSTAGSQYPFTGYKNFPRFRRVTLGSFSFDREFDNFLDFEPYTQAILYVPYCGIKQLPMNIFAGHTVNIYMNADNTSGVLQVLIFVDNIEWGTLSGMASEELPLVGETALTAANTKRELDYQQGQLEWGKMIGMGGSVAGASISAANKNPVGLIAQGASALFKNYYYNTQQAELQYQINHTKPEPLTIQKGDSSIDKMNVQYPFIMIQSPVIIGDGSFENIKQNYGRTKGFKCCETGVIGDFSGLTKCSAANLNGISCTYTEKKMIMEALQEGVIL